MYPEAVELALNHNLIELAKIYADKPLNDEVSEKL